MEPSFTVLTAFSGLVISGCSSSTSSMRCAAAADCVTMTKTMESIIRLIRMFMT